MDGFLVFVSLAAGLVWLGWRIIYHDPQSEPGMATFPFSNEKLEEIINQTERMMNKFLDQGSFKEVSAMRLKLIELREERDRREGVLVVR